LLQTQASTRITADGQGRLQQSPSHRSKLYLTICGSVAMTTRGGFHRLGSRLLADDEIGAPLLVQPAASEEPTIPTPLVPFGNGRI
jgi:hypothetical protein